MSFRIEKDETVDYLSANVIRGKVVGAPPDGSEFGNYIFWGTNGSWQVGRTSVNIGAFAGQTGARNTNIAIGNFAGNSTQGTSAIAIGLSSARTNQGLEAVAIGANAGSGTQGTQAVAIGSGAGRVSQGTQAVAIGFLAAPTNQTAGSICVNASGIALPATQAGFYARPVRSTNLGAGVNTMSYDPTTFEIVQNTSKTFIIPHPLDESKYLVHACLEGPEAGVYYRGQHVIPPSSESVVVDLPEYVRAFNSFTVQVTKVVRGAADLSLYGVSDVFDGKFKIYGSPGKYNYTVNAKRLDVEVEPSVSGKQVKSQGPYTWFE